MTKLTFQEQLAMFLDKYNFPLEMKGHVISDVINLASQYANEREADLSTLV